MMPGLGLLLSQDIGVGRRGLPSQNFTAGPWGSFMGSHRGTPPPTMATLRGGGQCGGD